MVKNFHLKNYPTNAEILGLNLGSHIGLAMNPVNFSHAVLLTLINLVDEGL